MKKSPKAIPAKFHQSWDTYSWSDPWTPVQYTKEFDIPKDMARDDVFRFSAAELDGEFDQIAHAADTEFFSRKLDIWHTRTVELKFKYQDLP